MKMRPLLFPYPFEQQAFLMLQWNCFYIGCLKALPKHLSLFLFVHLFPCTLLVQVCGGGPRMCLWHLRSLAATTVFDTQNYCQKFATFNEDAVSTILVIYSERYFVHIWKMFSLNSLVIDLHSVWFFLHLHHSFCVDMMCSRYSRLCL